MSMKDAIKEGDTFRENVAIKLKIPLFYEHSPLSKYCVEAIDYVLLTEGLLSPRLSMRTRLCMFVNATGGVGNNKATDMQQENNVRFTKDGFKGFGAGKTDQSMVRCSAAYPVVGQMCEKFEAGLGLQSECSFHKNKSTDEDVLALLQVMSNVRPFAIENREMGKCKVSGTLYTFDKDTFMN